jgi:hypothetical protein
MVICKAQGSDNEICAGGLKRFVPFFRARARVRAREGETEPK